MSILNRDISEIVAEKLPWEEFNNKTILITGANGMLGRYVTETFIKLKTKLNINLKLILLVRKNTIYQETEYIKIIEQDVVDPFLLDEKIDYIIHAASPASPLIMKEKPVDTFKANVIGTINCLELAKKNNANFIFISSREVYGSPIDTDVFKEETLGSINHFESRASYSEGKKASETIAISYMEQYNVNIKVLRLAHTYGPGININDGRVQSDFLKNYINNEPIKMNSDGSSIRTYTYISDAVIGMFYAILVGSDIVYNVADENQITSILNLANVISKINNKNLEVQYVRAASNTSYSPVKFGTISSEKLHLLGWNPKVNLQEGFKRTISFLEEPVHEKN